MFDCHRAGVEEDEDNDQPEPPLLLAHPANHNTCSPNAGGEFALGTCIDNYFLIFRNDNWEKSAYRLVLPPLF